MTRVWLREVVVFSLATALVVGLFSAGWWARGQVEAFKLRNDELNERIVVEGEPHPPLWVMVRQGETLWSIAREFYPDHHTGHVVTLIRELNPELDPGRLLVGDVVKLPRPEDLD